jgi:hypothetical protein
MDNDQQIFYAFDGTVQQTVQVNWDVVPRDSLQTLADLLKPEFAARSSGSIRARPAPATARRRPYSPISAWTG